jgi:hypothetical protein
VRAKIQLSAITKTHKQAHIKLNIIAFLITESLILTFSVERIKKMAFPWLETHHWFVRVNVFDLYSHKNNNFRLSRIIQFRARFTGARDFLEAKREIRIYAAGDDEIGCQYFLSLCTRRAKKKRRWRKRFGYRKNVPYINTGGFIFSSAPCFFRRARGVRIIFHLLRSAGCQWSRAKMRERCSALCFGKK